MSTSPLELYEQAYHLHYDENDIVKACQIYETIITEYPESNESAYAAIQLQKIHTNEVERKLLKARTGVHPVSIIALLLGFITFLGCIGLAYLFISYRMDESARTSMLFRALSKSSIGREEEALELLEEVKKSSGSDITPFALAADIHIQRNEIAKAKEEYELFKRLYTGQPNTAAVSQTTSPETEENVPPPTHTAQQRSDSQETAKDQATHTTPAKQPEKPQIRQRPKRPPSHTPSRQTVQQQQKENDTIIYFP
jgi:tetratricopeptide (TPR) repeat protein